MKLTKTILSLAVLILAVTACSKLKDLGSSDKLYFCEQYIPSSDKCEGESTKYTTGTLTVMVKLSKPIGATDVDINITDLATGKVRDTFPFTVRSSDTYIYFDGVEFKNPGKFKVSCLKKDGTVVISNEIEITDK